MARRLGVWGVLALIFGCGASADELPIIDAHSQLEKAVAPQRVIELMDQAGVARTILAARHGTTVESMKNLAKAHPDRITAAVRSKSSHYQDGALEDFRNYLQKQLKHPEFAAMAEVLIFHARKTNAKGKEIAPEVAFPPGDERVQLALNAAIKHGWPFIAHIEFRSLGMARGDDVRGDYMAQFEEMLSANPSHPFVLIHLAQLDAREAARLLKTHSNLYFIPAHVNPITAARTREPWGNIFEGESLAPAWRDLMATHPDRFVLGFDNVWANHWEELYIPQVKLWRKALGELSVDAAHAIAHGNAERLWGLPPVTQP